MCINTHKLTHIHTLTHTKLLFLKDTVDVKFKVILGYTEFEARLDYMGPPPHLHTLKGKVTAGVCDPKVQETKVETHKGQRGVYVRPRVHSPTNFSSCLVQGKKEPDTQPCHLLPLAHTQTSPHSLRRKGQRETHNFSHYFSVSCCYCSLGMI